VATSIVFYSKESHFPKNMEHTATTRSSGGKNMEQIATTTMSSGEIPPPLPMRRSSNGRRIKFLPCFFDWINYYQDTEPPDEIDKLIKTLYYMCNVYCTDWVEIDDLYANVAIHGRSIELTVNYDKVLERLLEYGIVHIT
jgi:hypothetical protein